MTCPICILEVGSYLRHNKRTGTASCSVSLKVVMALHLFWGKRLCLIFPIQTRRVQPEFKRKLKGTARCWLPPVSVTPHLAIEVLGFTSRRLQILSDGSIFLSTLLKQLSCKWGLDIFQGISRRIFDWVSPRGNTFTYQRLWSNALQCTHPMKSDRVLGLLSIILVFYWLF